MLATHFFKNFLEAGADEAGRGCLAGPVTCAAVLLPERIANAGKTDNLNLDITYAQLNDSKKLSEKVRESLRSVIEMTSLTFAVVHIYPKQIDEINILQASILGMQKAVLKLKCTPQHLIVDGNRFNTGNYLSRQNRNLFIDVKTVDRFDAGQFVNLKNQIPYTTIIKGDEKFMTIAAASILAKTHRDAYMNKIHKEYPMYNWAQNKGYPTKEHKVAILKYGLTKYHRLSFRHEL